MGAGVQMVNDFEKMLIKHILRLIAGLAVFSACVQEEITGIPVEFGNAGTEIELDMQYLVLDVPDDIVLGNIDQIADDGTYLYLLQTQSAGAGVYVFDLATGFFKCKIGNRGRGPGEYVIPMSFTLTDNRICIVDGASQKVMSYDTGDDFRYVGDRETGDISYFERCDGNGHLVSGNNSYYSDLRFHDKCFLVMDSTFTIIDGMIDKAFVSGYITGPLKPAYVYDGKVRLYTQTVPVIYEYDGKDMTVVCRLSFDGFSFPSRNYMKKISRGGKDYTGTLRESGYISYYDFFETGDALMTLFMAGGERYLGLYSKPNGLSKVWSGEGMAEISPYGGSLFISGVVRDRFAIVLPVSELKKSVLPSRLGHLVSDASETDIILQLVGIR